MNGWDILALLRVTNIYRVGLIMKDRVYVE